MEAVIGSVPYYKERRRFGISFNLLNRKKRKAEKNTKTVFDTLDLVRQILDQEKHGEDFVLTEAFKAIFPIYWEFRRTREFLNREIREINDELHECIEKYMDGDRSERNIRDIELLCLAVELEYDDQQLYEKLIVPGQRNYLLNYQRPISH